MRKWFSKLVEAIEATGLNCGAIGSCFSSWPGATSRFATKQTFIGVAWAIIRPLLVTIIFVVVFGRLANIPAPTGIPYPLL